MVLNKIGPKIWISILLITWGSIMMAMAAVKNSTQIFVARFFLGVAEAGLVPAILFYMSIWYTKQEQARRIAIFFAVSTCAGAFGGVLAYGLMQLDGVQGLGGWQWIFIIEAIPTLVLAIISYTSLPDYPETTPFLTEKERKMFMNMMAIDHGPTSEADSNFSWSQFFAVFKDWKTYAFSIIALCDIVCIYSISMFLPTIIHGMGFTALSAQGMSSFPYLVACIFTILGGISADKRKERGFHVMIPMLVATLGYILLIALKDQGVPGLYFATILVTTGMYAAYASFASWFTNNIAGRTKRSVAVALITSIGNVGGCIAGQLYRTSDAPHYVHGHAAALGFMVLGIIFTLALKFLFIHINKKRDNMTHEERYVIISKSTSIDLCDKVNHIFLHEKKNYTLISLLTIAYTNST
ncbi:major facilitator superfamily domain-containing protein [Circinella umbellata]|nr:major facilitator superfamily domain-containing protein [Circinella umbellata]